MCGSPALHRHHVAYRQWARDLPAGVNINSPANLVSLCCGCHGRHHSGFRKIPVSRLPSAALEFALTNGFEGRLRRQYDYDIQEDA
jgi:hypothetical protein